VVGDLNMYDVFLNWVIVLAINGVLFYHLDKDLGLIGERND